MKKYISLVLACVLMLSMLSMPALAADEDAYEPPIVTPRYTYLSNCWAGLTPTGGGWYDVTGGAGSAVGTVKISVTVILQRSNPQSITGWDDIVTLTDCNQYSASASTSRYIATAGTYRTLVTVEVYTEDGTLAETETVFSRRVDIS